MKSAHIFLIAFFIIICGAAHAQKDKTVYYFLDAVSANTSTTAKKYFYSFPIMKTTVAQLNADKTMSKFKKQLKAEHGIIEFSSAVVRSNDSFDEARNLMSRYLDKYKAEGYTVIKVSLHDD